MIYGLRSIISSCACNTVIKPLKKKISGWPVGALLKIWRKICGKVQEKEVRGYGWEDVIKWKKRYVFFIFFLFIVVSVENSILTQPWCSWDQADYQTPVSLPGGPCLYVTVTQITAAVLIHHKVCEKQVVSPGGLLNRAFYLSHPILHGDNLGVFIEEKLP